ncbi:DNA topoisomerase I, partial [Candidatus Saccharibacteria bacterium]|nr:DNA topoisomerase I [Candidatus Saccharibacteria bacterium]
EREIENIEKKFSFKITGTFGEHEFSATLDKHQPATETAARELLEKLTGATYTVDAIEQTEGKKANPVPITTAAMQIEANSRLGFAAGTTMRAAQVLYQAGLITYHRTDSLNLSKQALASIASYIEKEFGKNYLQVRHFKTKDASAQEAHEAIRPTDITRESAGKNDYEKKLYNLIRTRTLATQMANAKVAKTTIKLQPSTIQPQFIAKGEVVIFDGFLRVYGSSKDTELPALKKGDTVAAHEIIARQTFAKPPARYTEGSLVKKLEELGIGRPSTYAGIMSALQTRGYVRKGEGEGRERQVIELRLCGDAGNAGAAEHEDLARAARSVSEGHAVANITRTITTEKSGATKGKLLPTPVGELVSDFLTEHFDQIVDYGFTAGVEEKLDLIAEAKLERVQMLRDFYTPFSAQVGKSQDAERYNAARELGTDPKTKLPIFAKIGRNGGFIQLGLNEKESGAKPRFAPLPAKTTVKTVTYEQALQQLALPQLPRSLGQAKDGTELIAAAGPFGPYLKGGKYNIPIKGHDPYTITLKDAEPLYQAKIDSIIADWDDIMIINGAYGPYIKGPGRWNNLKIPKEMDPKKITREEAEKMLADKPKKKTRRAPRRRATKAKKSAKKS